MKYFITILFLFLSANFAYAQDIIIKGRVLDFKSGRAVQGANILLKDSFIGSASAVDGSFIFRIKKSSFNDSLKVVITHIAYKRYLTDIRTLITNPIINLELTVIRTPEVEIVGKRNTRAANDLPASVTTISVRENPAQAVMDVGDLLARESSIKIEESISGKKYVSIRGSNADEVLVLYDGIPLNSGNNNVANLSEINLLDIDRIELIKGSNTSIYGTGIFGGVINIVPRTDTEQTVQFNARTGTFDTKDFSFHTSGNFRKIQTKYNFRTTESLKTSEFFNVPNKQIYHSAKISYEGTQRKIKVSARISDADYLDLLTLNNRDEISTTASVVYSGPLLMLKEFSMTGLYRSNSQKENFEDALFEKGKEIYYREKVEDTNWLWRIEDREVHGNWEYFYGLDHKSTDFKGLIDVENVNLGLNYSDDDLLSRTEEGIFGIAKMHGAISSDLIQYTDWDISFRYYDIETKRAAENLRLSGETGNDSYNGITYKLGFKTGGGTDFSKYYLFLTRGNNIKSPSLRQLFNADNNEILDYQGQILRPEKNFSTEIGVHYEYSRSSDMNYFSELGVHAAWFKNEYLDKIIEFQPIIGPPIPINTKTASTIGLDIQADITLIRDLLSFNMGALILDLNNQAAFPFKPDKKFSATGTLRRGDFQLSATWFLEGEQTALFYYPGNPIGEFSTDSRTDFDFHAKWKAHIQSLEIDISFTGLNLKNSGEEVPVPGVFFMGTKQWYLNFGVKL